MSITRYKQVTQEEDQPTTQENYSKRVKRLQTKLYMKYTVCLVSKFYILNYSYHISVSLVFSWVRFKSL